MKWLRSHWRALAIGAGGFVVGIAVGAGSPEETKTTTVAQTVIERRTVTRTQTVAGPVRFRTRVRKPTAVTRTVAATPATESSTNAKSFSGNGSKNLGTIAVSHDSTVRWTNDGDIFQVFDDDFGFGINSQGHSGESALAAGTYKNVSVNALGSWTLRIVG